jgi:hypothetical protein
MLKKLRLKLKQVRIGRALELLENQGLVIITSNNYEELVNSEMTVEKMEEALIGIGRIISRDQDDLIGYLEDDGYLVLQDLTHAVGHLQDCGYIIFYEDHYVDDMILELKNMDYVVYKKPEKKASVDQKLHDLKSMLNKEI